MESGTIAAHTPIVVPTRTRVSGNSATSKMMNGVERSALTRAPSVEFTVRRS